MDTKPAITWGAQSVRATYFAVQTSKKVEELFSKCVGKQPDAYQSAAGMMQASGSTALGQIVLNISPGRYDITLVPLPPPIVQPAQGVGGINHDVIEDVSASLVIISDSMKKLGRELAFPTRCAMAVDLSKAAATIEGANSLLNEVLPYGIVLTNENDFVLQRNDLASFGSVCAEFNCLSRWCVNTVQQMMFATPGQIGIQAAGSIISSYYTAQKFIDVNTRTPLKLGKAELISELFDGMMKQIEKLRKLS